METPQDQSALPYQRQQQQGQPEAPAKCSVQTSSFPPPGQVQLGSERRSHNLGKLRKRELYSMALEGGDTVRGYCSCDEYWTASSPSPPRSVSPVATPSPIAVDAQRGRTLLTGNDSNIAAIEIGRDKANRQSSTSLLASLQLQTKQQILANLTRNGKESSNGTAALHCRTPTTRIRQQYRVRFSDEKNFSD